MGFKIDIYISLTIALINCNLNCMYTDSLFKSLKTYLILFTLI